MSDVIREIKFRVPVYTAKGKFYCWHYWGFVKEGYGSIVFKGCIDDPVRSQAESQQFTGRRDKNGKEIYQGDQMYGFSNLLFTVVWEPELARFIALSKSEHEYISPECWKDHEVIGNVVQNPEMMPEVK
jgi:hypothetical protein